HCWRAEALVRLENHAEARRSFDAYLKDPRPLPQPQVLAHVYLGRGLTRAKLGDDRGAIDDYNQALRLWPDSLTCAWRGWAYLAVNAPWLARGDFDKEVKLKLDYAEAWCGLGLAQARLGQADEAWAAAAQALKHGSMDAQV